MDNNTMLQLYPIPTPNPFTDKLRTTNWQNNPVETHIAKTMIPPGIRPTWQLKKLVAMSYLPPRYSEVGSICKMHLKEQMPSISPKPKAIWWRPIRIKMADLLWRIRNSYPYSHGKTRLLYGERWSGSIVPMLTVQTKSSFAMHRTKCCAPV